MKLKPLHQQTMVITGASSGIGLATARMAADRGARLVLAARNEDALRDIVAEIRDRGGQAIAVPCDVGKEEQIVLLANRAQQEFGRFDTWVNDAGVSIYGKIEDVPVEDQRKLFETNVWGVVHGSRVAAEHLRRHGGGAIINIGSILSDVAVPLQGTYAASKHAVKGLTDALRMELMMEGAPISVTLIKPSAIDTPYRNHARNYLGDGQPELPPPLYAPQLVAQAILHAAEHPVRDLIVGGGGRMMTAMGQLFPGFTDWYMAKAMPSQERRQMNDRPRGDNLRRPGYGGEERGGYPGMVMSVSPYTWTQMHPVAALAIGAGIAGLAATLFSRRG